MAEKLLKNRASATKLAMKRPKQNSTFTFTDKPEKLSTHCRIKLNGKLNVFIHTTLHLQSTEVYFMPMLPDRKQIVINPKMEVSVIGLQAIHKVLLKTGCPALLLSYPMLHL